MWITHGNVNKAGRSEVLLRTYSKKKSLDKDAVISMLIMK